LDEPFPRGLQVAIPKEGEGMAPGKAAVCNTAGFFYLIGRFPRQPGNAMQPQNM